VKRNQLLIGGAALLAIVLLWWFVLYAPLGDDLDSAKTQRDAEESQTDSLRADLTRLQGQQKNGTQQQALLRKLGAAVPEQPDLAEFIIQANEIADQSGISFLSIAPTPPVAGTGASVIGLTISIQGSFFQLQDYLRLLEKLERLVIVDGITISGSGGGASSTTGTGSSTDASTSSSGEGTTLGVTLTARMFTRAAPVGGTTDGSTTPGATTTTTVPGATTTTVPASGSSTTGGT
jgi:Tfp pilus assembly protein PilO